MRILKLGLILITLGISLASQIRKQIEGTGGAATGGSGVNIRGRPPRGAITGTGGAATGGTGVNLTGGDCDTC